MRLPQLVATDLDGTLLHSDGTVTPRTRSVLEELDGRGIPVVFTTGRPLRWMEDLWADVGDHGLAICSNGAIVYDVAQRRVREVHAVSRRVALKVTRDIRAAIPGTTFAIEHTQGWAREAQFPHHPDDRSEGVTGDFDDIYRDDVAKILAVHRELEPATFWRRVEGVTAGAVNTTWSSTFALVEISAAGVTKASALERLAGEMGVAPGDVVAFGDMPNDLPMLEWAGMSYAMANAHPSVLEMAQHRAPTNDEDGVAQVLAELFDLSG